MKFRKKPIVIEAVQWKGDNCYEVASFLTGEVESILETVYLYGITRQYPIIIPTLEGDHIANVGDWIIKGVKGEFYPVKNDIFLETYEQVD